VIPQAVRYAGSERASFGWFVLLAFAATALPWYRGQGLGIDPAASALAEVAGGSVWLLPVPFVAVGLAMLALTSDMRRHPVFLPLVVAGLVLTLGQGFVIGLRGPVLTEIVELFPAAASGQQGFGWGAFLSLLAMLSLISDGMAARGFCRGERFPTFAIVLILALLATFVFFPVLRLAAAAFIGPDGTLAADAFVARVTAPELWRLDFFVSGSRCGVVINTVQLGLLAATLSTALGLALA